MDDFVRIAKRIAQSGICSRRAAEQFIIDKRVSVDGNIITSLSTKVSADHVVCIDGKPISKKSNTLLFVFYKPRGCITSHRDPQGRKTIFDFLPNSMSQLCTIGRLDYNTEGLILLTNNGDFARYMELPSSCIERVYRVRAHGKINKKKIDLACGGIVINGIRYAPFTLNHESSSNQNHWFTVTIKEGKNREIRKLFSFMDLLVNRLIRISYGPFLIGKLKPGEYTDISIPEYMKKGLYTS